MKTIIVTKFKRILSFKSSQAETAESTVKVNDALAGIDCG